MLEGALVYPFEILSFPALAVPHRYPNGCTFDTSRGGSLTQALRLTLHANSRHFAQFNKWTPITFDRVGPAISFTFTPGVSNEIEIPQLSPADDFSFFIRMRAISPPANAGDSNVVSFLPYFLFRWNHDGGTRTGSISFDTPGRTGSVKIQYPWHTRWMTLSFNCGYDYQGFINGASMSFEMLNTDTALRDNSPFTLGERWNGRMSVFYYWNRSLSRGEHLLLHRDPYRLLSPS